MLVVDICDDINFCHLFMLRWINYSLILYNYCRILAVAKQWIFLQYIAITPPRRYPVFIEIRLCFLVVILFVLRHVPRIGWEKHAYYTICTWLKQPCMESGTCWWCLVPRRMFSTSSLSPLLLVTIETFNHMPPPYVITELVLIMNTAELLLTWRNNNWLITFSSLSTFYGVNIVRLIYFNYFWFLSFCCLSFVCLLFVCCCSFFLLFLCF